MQSNMIFRIVFSIILFVLSGCSKLSVEQQLKKAEKDYAVGSYQSAIVQLKNVIKDDPNNLKARLLIANSYYQLGTFVSAEKEYTKSIDLGIDVNEISPNYVNSLYALEDLIGIIDFWNENENLLSETKRAQSAPVISLANLSLGNYLESFNLIRKSKDWAENSNNQELIDINGNIYNTFEKPVDKNKQISNLKQACDGYPKRWIVCNLLANAYYADNNYQGAASVIEEILEGKPNHHKLLIKLVDSHLKAENYDEAKKYLTPLLKIFPNLPYINQLAAISAMHQNDYEKALKYISAALNKNYTTPQVRFIAATIHYQLKNYEQAFFQLQGLKDRFPNNSLISQLYIATQIHIGNVDSLYKDVEGIEVSTKNTDLFAAAAIELYKLNEIEKSDDILSKINSEDIENPTLLKNTSIAKLASGDQSGIEGLEKLFNKLITDGASSTDIYKSKLLLISSLLANNELNQAYSHTNRWVSEDPINVQNLELLAEVEKKLSPKNSQKVKETYNKILELDNSNITANLYLGNLALTQQNYKRALNYFNKAIEKSNNKEVFKGYYLASEKLNGKEKTLSSIEKKLTNNNNDFRKKILLAQIYLLSNSPKNVIELLTPFSTVNNENLTATIIFLTDAYIMDSDYLSAVATMEEGIENNISLTTKNLTTLSTLYERINSLERAIQTFENLHLNHPKNIQIGLILANFYTFTEQKDKALDYISTLTNQQQNHSAVLALKGKALYHQKKYQEALPFLLESYEKNNNNKLMSYIFDCQIRLNNNDLAIEAMAKHLESNPGAVNNKIVYANELRKVDSQLAIAQYKEIIEKDARNIVALNNIAWLFFEQSKLIEAKKYIDQAVLYYPNNKDVIDTLNKINSAMK